MRSPPTSLYTPTDPSSPTTHHTRVARASACTRTSSAISGCRMVKPSTHTSRLDSSRSATTDERMAAAQHSSSRAAPGTTTCPCRTWSPSQPFKMPACRWAAQRMSLHCRQSELVGAGTLQGRAFVGLRRLPQHDVGDGSDVPERARAHPGQQPLAISATNTSGALPSGSKC